MNQSKCGNCRREFFSRSKKKYCTLFCYTSSDQYKKMMAENIIKARSPEAIEKRAKSSRKGFSVACLECGKEFYTKRYRVRRFCSFPHYRAYMNKRYDRFMANPESIALPQCYDEFLDREELKCIIGDCTWEGRHLSVHVNQAHGILANEFKKMTGFNLSSGLVSKDLSLSLSKREMRGVALDHIEKQRAAAKVAQEGWRKSKSQPSLEAVEHRKKSRILMGPGPEQSCRECGATFRRMCSAGRSLYCSIPCRTRSYHRNRANKRFI